MDTDNDDIKVVEMLPPSKRTNSTQKMMLPPKSSSVNKSYHETSMNSHFTSFNDLVLTSDEIKIKQEYWKGKEHLKGIGPSRPYVVIDRLPDLSGLGSDKGHKCEKVCFQKKIRTSTEDIKRDALHSNHREQFNKLNIKFNKTHNELKSFTKAPLPSLNNREMPVIGDLVSFKLTKLGSNSLHQSSELRRGRVTKIIKDKLIEIRLSDLVFANAIVDGTKIPIAFSRMMFDWDTLIEPRIIGKSEIK